MALYSGDYGLFFSADIQMCEWIKIGKDLKISRRNKINIKTLLLHGNNNKDTKKKNTFF